MQVQKLLKNRKKVSILVLCLCVLCIILFVFMRNKVPKNVLLQGSICHQWVLPTSGNEYIYKYIDVCCNESDLSSFTEKDYIEFLEKGVEGFANDVGEYRISFNDNGTGILYINGDSSKGYYVDRSVSPDTYVMYEPSNSLCKVKGLIVWDGNQVTYTPVYTKEYLGNLLPPYDPKYQMPNTQENQNLLVKSLPMW